MMRPVIGDSSDDLGQVVDTAMYTSREFCERRFKVTHSQDKRFYNTLVHTEIYKSTMSEGMIFTARIRRMGKVLFSQVSVCPLPGGYPSPRFFPRSLVPGPF